MSRLRIAICLLAFSSLAGCASQIQTLTDQLNATTPCCSAYREMSFALLPLDEEVTSTVGPGSEAFRFQEGLSYFAGFRLPERAGNYRFEITTLLEGGWIPTAHVFYPLLTVLDVHYERVGVAAPAIYYDEGWLEGSRWKATVKVPGDAAFVIVHTFPDLVNHPVQVGHQTSGFAYSTPTGAFFVPGSGPKLSAFGPAGTVRIKLAQGID